MYNNTYPTLLYIYTFSVIVFPMTLSYVICQFLQRLPVNHSIMQRVSGEFAAEMDMVRASVHHVSV